MASNTKKAPARDEPIDAIPMKKSNPLMILAIIAGLAAVIGVVAFTFSRGKADKAANQKQAEQAAQAQAAATQNMTPEEQRRHLEITQKSLAAWKDQKAADEAKKKAEEEAAKEKEAAAAAPAPIAKAGAPAPAGDDEPAPAPKKKPPPKKEMDALEGLGSDITGKLGK